jgi:hypothetical protein
MKWNKQENWINLSKLNIFFPWKNICNLQVHSQNRKWKHGELSRLTIIYFSLTIAALRRIFITLYSFSLEYISVALTSDLGTRIWRSYLWCLISNLLFTRSEICSKPFSPAIRISNSIQRWIDVRNFRVHFL